MADSILTSCEACSDPEPMEAQLQRHRKLIYLAVHRFLRARPDLATDIEQEARIALADALKNYRAEMGFTFSTYAVRQMRWRAWKFLDRFTRKDRVTASLDEPRGESDGDDFNLLSVIDAQLASKDLNQAIADEHLLRRICDLREAIAACPMTRRERIVVNKFLESSETIAAELDVSPQRVSQVMMSVVRKLRRHLKLSGLPSSHDLTITD